MNAAAAEHGAVNKWIVAATVVTGAFMAVMDITVVNIALPHMMGTFSESMSAITWVATSYSIASITLATMAGWLTTLLGRKKLYLISFAVFTLGSILAGTARSFDVMLVYRVIQGIGGGALIPVSQAVLREAFPDEEQGMAMAIFSMGVVLAPGIGAILGGYLTQQYGWPWIFYINVPVGIVGMFMIMAFVHDPHYLKRGVRRIDFIGILLLVATMTAAQIVLERGEQYNWLASEWIRIGIAITAVSGIALLIWEIFIFEHPVVNFRLLKNVPLTLGSSIGLIFGLALFGTTFVIPQFTQDLLGYSAYESGQILMPRAITLFLLMPVAGWLYRYVDSRLLIFVGLAIIMVSLFDLGGISLQTGFWNLVPILLLMGCGMPFMFVTMTTVALSTVPREHMTEATSIYTLSRRVGGNVGYAIVATIVERRGQLHHERLGSFISAYDPTYQWFYHHTTATLTHHGMNPEAAPTIATAIAQHLLHLQAVMMSYNDVSYLMGMTFLATIPLILLLPSRKKQLAQLAAARQAVAE